MRTLKTILKLTLLFAPLIYVISKVDIRAFADKISSTPFELVLLAGLILVIRIALQSFRFSLLTKPFTKAINFRTLLVADLKAKYYSLVIPSSVGQDIVRGTLLKEHLTADQTVGISLFFRLTGVLPLLLLSAIGLINLAGFSEIRDFLPYLGAGASFLILFTLALLSKRISKWVGRKVRPILPEKITKFIRQSVTAIQLYRGHAPLAVINIGISVVTQILIVGFSSVLLKAITGNFHFLSAISFIPVIEIIAILVPFAPNGAGVREAGYIAMFRTLGESDESRVLFITLSLMMYFVNLTGIVIILWEKLTRLKRKGSHE